MATKRAAKATVGRASRTGEQYREIQRGIDAKDRAKPAEARKGGTKAVHAGDRKQPENPLPKQHLAKPGLEADLELKPRYLAPTDKGSEKLQDMVAIIPGEVIPVVGGHTGG